MLIHYGMGGVNLRSFYPDWVETPQPPQLIATSSTAKFYFSRALCMPKELEKIMCLPFYDLDHTVSCECLFILSFLFNFISFK